MKYSLCILLALILNISFANAMTTYTYYGNNYNSVTTGNYYDNTMNVTGSFSLDNPLATNLNSSSITGLSGFSFSFNDGTSIPITSTHTGIDVNTFNVSTNGTGNITGWNFILFDYGTAPYLSSLPHELLSDSLVGDQVTSSSLVDCSGGGGIIVDPSCSPLITDTATAPRFSPTSILANEVWTVTNNAIVPVPEPSTFLLLGGGLAGLAFVVRRKKKS